MNLGANSPFEQMAVLGDYRFRIEFWAILGCVGLSLVLFELVRRNRLKERYSLLWLLTAGSLLTLALKRSWLDDLARVAGIYYAPSALFLTLVFFMILILVHFSTVLSALITAKQRLTQEIALLERRVREIEDSVTRASETSSTEDSEREAS